jgi:acetyl esterase
VRIDRARYAAARWLLKLPPSWQVRLGGGRPVTVDGGILDPGIQLLLALRRYSDPRLPSLSPEAARRRIRAEAAAVAAPPVPVGAVTDRTVDGADGPLPARHYAPDEPGGPHPLLVYYHGGGFVLGDLETHDQLCRLLARHAGVHVLSIDYRLAPEHPFPAAPEDAWAALRWAAAHAAELGADPARLAVAGDSAGGNLAAGVAQRAVRAGGPALALQLLLYPTVDRAGEWPSLDLFAENFFLTRAEIAWFHGHYSAGADDADPRLSPLRGAELPGQPPAIVVTAAFDPLRDEGEAHAAALAAAGNPVRLRREAGMVHGFANMVDLSAAARVRLVEIAGEVRTLLAGAPAEREAPR